MSEGTWKAARNERGDIELKLHHGDRTTVLVLTDDWTTDIDEMRTHDGRVIALPFIEQVWEELQSGSRQDASRGHPRGHRPGRGGGAVREKA